MLERKASKEEKVAGIDLADYLTLFDWREFIEPKKDTAIFSTSTQPLKEDQQKDETWNIAELEHFFKSNNLPKTFKPSSFEYIYCVKTFVKSHLKIVKRNNGVKTYKPYLERLINLREMLKKEQNLNKKLS